MKTIELENVGPIEQLSIPIPEDGGVVVLRGRNGAGKSTALHATEALLRGKGSLNCRDGAIKGSVNGFGARMFVGKSTRHSGELEAVHLEDRLSIAELVDPGLKDAVAADKRRIKALVNLTGATPDLDMFRNVLGGDAVSLVSADCSGTNDLLEMAELIRRDLHAEARRRESEAEQEKGRASGIRESVGEVSDVDALPSEEALREDVLAFVREQSELQERHRQAIEAGSRCKESRQKLLAAEAKYDGPTVADATSARDNADAECVEAQAALEEAQRRHEQAFEAFERAQQVLSAAENHERMTAGWKQAINDAEDIDVPTEEELAEADRMVNVVQARQEEAATHRANLARLAQADEHAANAKKIAEKAKELRDAAKATDEVLASAIKCDGLGVLDGRLVTTTSRGETYFSDLSQGERWAIALRIAAATVGDTGLIVVPQPAWEGLDANNRELVAAKAKEHRVTVLTAEAQRNGEEAELVVG